MNRRRVLSGGLKRSGTVILILLALLFSMETRAEDISGTDWQLAVPFEESAEEEPVVVIDEISFEGYEEPSESPVPLPSNVGSAGTSSSVYGPQTSNDVATVIPETADDQAPETAGESGAAAESETAGESKDAAAPQPSETPAPTATPIPTPIPLTLQDRLTQSGSPALIMEFVTKYPEAEPFALNYAVYSELDSEIDLTEEVKEGEIPLFIQWDPRWAYRIYGSNYLGINGCGPTCLAMVYCGLTGDTSYDPYQMAMLSQEKGYYQSGVGTSWSLMTAGAEALGLKSFAISGNAEEIRSYLEKGDPVIVSVGPGDFTYVGHFIVLTQIDENWQVTIRDPNSPEHSSQTWGLDEILKQTRKVWAYELPEAQEP